MRRIISVILVVLIGSVLHAQHVVEIGVRAGVAGYKAKCEYVSPIANLHAGLQLSYTYHTPKVVGVRVGVLLERHSAGFGKKGIYEDSYTTIDVENDQMQVDYWLDNLREMHHTWSVGIPAQLALSWKNAHLYIGPKAVFPLACRWKETTGYPSALQVYYPRYDNRVYESTQLAASRAFSEQRQGKRALQTVQWWLSAEIAYDIPLTTVKKSWYARGSSYKSFLSIGFYADYSFSQEKSTGEGPVSLLMLSDTRDGFPLQRILTPVVEAQRQGTKLVSAWQPFDVGIKVTYAIAPFNPYKKTHCNCIQDIY